ncbi:MAG: hypothetical protein ACYCPT_12210 [Acidimicrobiales bacterium]
MVSYCRHINCSKTPSFGYIDKKVPVCCRSHKLKNMINVRTTCKYKNCINKATHNSILRKTARYCCIHSSELMFQINRRKKTMSLREFAIFCSYFSSI